MTFVSIFKSPVIHKGQGPFAPDVLPGVNAWMDSGSIGTLFQDSAQTTPVAVDGDVVGAWRDRLDAVPTFIQGTTANKPLYKDTPKTHILFDGTDDYLDGNNVATPLIPATADWALYGAIRTGADVTDPHEILSQHLSGPGNGRILFRVASGTVSLFLGSGLTNETVVAGVAAINTEYIFSFRRQGNTFTGRLLGVDGTPLAEGSQRSILQTGNLIGARSDSATTYNSSPLRFWNGRIYELVLQIGTATTKDLSQIDRYLSDANGIALL